MANFVTIRVTKTSKAMQITAIRTVANSLPENEIILLTLLISMWYVPYTDLLKICILSKNFQTYFVRLLKVIDKRPIKQNIQNNMSINIKVHFC